MSVCGAYMVTSAPSFFKPKRLLLATREWEMSPKMATLSPSMEPKIFAHRQHIQKRLRRMLVHAVARVDDVRLHRPPEKGAALRPSDGG